MAEKTKPKPKLIKNFGLFWDADSVNWGGRKKEPYFLIGYDAHHKKRLASFDRQIAIYVLYDSSLKPIYIGQVGSGDQRLYKRLKQHKVSDHLAGRWNTFSWFGLLTVVKKKEEKSFENKPVHKLEDRTADKVFSATGTILLDQFESILLAGAEPSLNKQGPKWHKAENFKQKLLKPTIESELSSIGKRLEKIEKLTNKRNVQLRKRKRKKAR